MSTKKKAAAVKGEERSALVPKLRFPEFRNEAGWKQECLGSLGSFTRGLTYSSSDVAEDGLLVLRSTNIQDGSLVLDKDLVFVGKTCPESLRLKKGDIVVCMSNGSKALVGKSAEYFGDYTDDLTVGAFCSFYRPSCAFAKLAFQIGSYQKYVADLIAGGNISNLTNTVLEEFDFPAPSSFAEQQKTAECLSSVDDVMVAQARKVGALKIHKKGLMQQLFPREGETQPRLRFKEFRNARGWGEGRLADIAIVLQGYGFPERHQGQKSGDYPFYKVSDISRSLAAGKVFIEESANYINESILKELRAKPIPEGTTIFAKIGEAIRSNRRAITTVPCLIDNNAAGVRRIEGKATDMFIYFLMEQISLIDHAGGVVPAVNKSAIEEIAIKFPEPDEQERIASCLSGLDALITAEAHKLEALKTHKRGLMQQLFPSMEATEA